MCHCMVDPIIQAVRAFLSQPLELLAAGALLAVALFVALKFLHILGLLRAALLSRSRERQAEQQPERQAEQPIIYRTVSKMRYPLTSQNPDVRAVRTWLLSGEAREEEKEHEPKTA